MPEFDFDAENDRAYEAVQALRETLDARILAPQLIIGGANIMRALQLAGILEAELVDKIFRGSRELATPKPGDKPPVVRDVPVTIN